MILKFANFQTNTPNRVPYDERNKIVKLKIFFRHT